MQRIYTLLFIAIFCPLVLLAADGASDNTMPQEKSTNHERVMLPSDHDIAPMPDPPHMDADYQKQFFKTLVAIIVIILVALFIIWVIRRSGPTRIYQSNKQKNIKVIERRAISNQTYLYHIQVGDKQFIMSESKMDVRTLATMDWPDSPS